MINRTSLISSRLQLFKFKTQEKQEQPKEQSKDKEPSSQEQKQVQASAQEILSLQNSIFLSMYKQQTANLNHEKQLDTNNSPTAKNTQPSTTVSSENNFFLTKRTINLDDLIQEPIQSGLQQPTTTPAKTRSASTGGFVVDKGTNLADKFTSVMSQVDLTSMPSQMANGIQEFASLIKNQEQYNTVINIYADYWMQKNNVAEITTGNVKEFMTSFLGEEFNINVANLGKMAGGAALLSIASQIVVSSAAERFPKMAKDVVNLGKDFYGNLFKGNIVDSLKALGKIPTLIGQWTVKGVKSLAKNT